jgi:hypothetical protein
MTPNLAPLIERPRGASAPATLMANCIKRILGSDTGALAERLDVLFAQGLDGGAEAVFLALTGRTSKQLLARLEQHGAAPEWLEDPQQQLTWLASRKMVELNLTFAQAAQYVLKINPELARAYRDYTLHPIQGGTP